MPPPSPSFRRIRQTPGVSDASAIVAVLVVRAGQLPGGVGDLLTNATDVVLVGTGVATVELSGGVAGTRGFETGAAPLGSWAGGLGPYLAELARAGDRAAVLLPAGPDAAVLGPGLAHCLGWPFIAGAIEAGPGWATKLLPDGLTVEELAIDGSFVATVVFRANPRTSTGSGSANAPSRTAAPSPPAEVVHIEALFKDGSDEVGVPHPRGTVEALGELPAVVATMDLADAERIVAAGAGLGESERLPMLAAVGERIGAAMGATRVLADRGWVSHRRQIGTTGVAVNPRLYLAFGISGASQHTSGLGQPDHVVSVNVDASCPMMAMADLAVVADAPEVLVELARLLGVDAL